MIHRNTITGTIQIGDTVIFPNPKEPGEEVIYKYETTRYLTERGGTNEKIFMLLGMSDSEKYALACEHGITGGGGWPETISAKAHTALINDLFARLRKASLLASNSNQILLLL